MSIDRTSPTGNRPVAMGYRPRDYWQVVGLLTDSFKGQGTDVIGSCLAHALATRHVLEVTGAKRQTAVRQGGLLCQAGGLLPGRGAMDGPQLVSSSSPESEPH